MRINTFHFLSGTLLLAASLSTAPMGRAQPQTRSFELQGEVRDQLNSVIVGASVRVTNGKDFVRESVSDERGRFRFVDLLAGTYTLSVTAEGFAVYEAAQELQNRSTPVRLSITLYPSSISESVTVGDDGGNSLDAGRAAGTQILSEREVQALPDDPDRIREQLQTLAASSGSVPGEATVTVDGFLAGGSLPPKSAIREVRINPDLYSAEYDTPPYRGGRIEILTRPGAEAFRGSAFFNFNDSAFNARNAFALERAPTETRRYGFQLGTPIVKRRAGFFLDFERRDIDEAATINAVVLNDAFQFVPFTMNVLTPSRLTIGSTRFDWQANVAHSFIARYDFNRNRLINQNVGGFNLPGRASNNTLIEQSLRFTETAIINPTALNELRVGITWLRRDERAASNAVAVIVPGAFSQGGASLQNLARNERRLEIVDNVSTTRGKHNLKFGAQLYNRSVEDERADNPQGTFFFGGTLAPSLDVNDSTPSYISGLEQYRRTLLGLPGGVPTRFTITQGAPDVAVNQWLFAVFAQDEWRIRPKISLSLGLRYEGQTAPHDVFNLAPRAGIAYSPDREQHWVLRARAGLFYERIADALTLDTLRLDGVRQRQLIVDAPSFSNPLGDGASARTISTFRRLDSALRSPASLQMRVEVERQLPRGWRVSASHSWARGWNSLRSRNINAPLIQEGVAPNFAPRPFGASQDILQFESSGKINGRVLFIGLFQTTNRRFTIASGYLNFDFRTNADTPYQFPQSSYTDAGEFAPPFWQARHRFFLTSNINLPLKLRANISVNAASGTPFNVTTGRDTNADNNFNDRPSIVDANNPNAIITRFGALDPTAVNGNLPRNAGTNPATMTFDLNLNRTFMLGRGANGNESRYRMTVNIAAYNLLNHANPLGLNGVLASPFFGRANAAAPARRVEFGLRFNF